VYGPNGAKAVSLATGETVQLYAFVLEAGRDSTTALGPTSVQWESRATSVALPVNQTGVVRGISSGTAFIVLTLNGVFRDSLTITVR
jgi:uncharacterized protein YjdB